MKALLLENIHSEAVRALEGRGYQVELRSGALGEAELADALEGVELQASVPAPISLARCSRRIRSCWLLEPSV